MKTFQYILSVVFSVGFVYSIIAFVCWEFPVDFGSFDVESSGIFAIVFIALNIMLVAASYIEK